MMRTGLSQKLTGRTTPLPRGRAVTVIRCETATTKAVFKVHRHIQFGQSLIITGGDAQLGSWDPVKGLTLLWSEGDVWTAEADLPAGTKVEYKYVIQANNNFNWCAGSNKAVTLPPAEAATLVELKAEGEGDPEIRILEAARAPEAAAAGPVPISADINSTASSQITSSAVPEQLATPIENAETSVLSTSSTEGVTAEVPEKAYTANNIVSGSNLGAVVMTQETRDAALLNVEEEYASVTAGVKPPPASVDHLTVNELKAQLKKRGLPVSGNRRILITRLQNAGAV